MHIDQTRSAHVYHMPLPGQIRVHLGLGSTPQQRLLAAARRLANDVRTREAAALARLVADSGDTVPADVGFAQPALVHWRTDGGRQRGRLADIHAYYQGLNRGRLMIRGPAGAGKTVLAIALTCEIARRFLGIGSGRRGVEGSANAVGPVAVRLSASSFNLAGNACPDGSSADQFAARLDAWLIGQIQTTYGIAQRDAAGLVNGGWIIPVLDGVDEMDSPEDPPIRASLLLEALNRHAPSADGGLRPVVVTCRTDRYAQLVDPLQDATVVDVEPLTPAAIRGYLLYQFPDPCGSMLGQPRWRPVLGRLARDCSRGDPPADPLTSALRSPLRLFLAVDGYRDPTSDPGELLRFSGVDQLDAHLFARLIPAAVGQHVGRDGRYYATEQVTRWLTTLSRHLGEQELAGGSGSDVRLDHLWRVAGRRLRHVTALTLVLPFVLTLLWTGLDTDALLGNAAFASIALLRASRPADELERFDVRILATQYGRRQVGRQVVQGFIHGVRLGLLFGVVINFGGHLYRTVLFDVAFPSVRDPAIVDVIVVPILLFTFVSGMLFAVVFGLRVRPSAVESPRQLVVQGVSYTSGTLLAAVIAGPAVYGLRALYGNSGAFSSWAGATVGLWLAIVILASSPWLRYLVACVISGRQCQLPRRSATFLTWACDAGLLRLAGLAVQFRHRELQEWLMTSTAASRLPAPGSSRVGVAELHAHPRAGPAALRDRVLPRPLARPAHHEQVAGPGAEEQRLAAAGRPEPERTGRAQGDKRDDGLR